MGEKGRQDPPKWFGTDVIVLLQIATELVMKTTWGAKREHAVGEQKHTLLARLLLLILQASLHPLPS